MKNLIYSDYGYGNEPNPVKEVVKTEDLQNNFADKKTSEQDDKPSHRIPDESIQSLVNGSKMREVLMLA